MAIYDDTINYYTNKLTGVVSPKLIQRRINNYIQLSFAHSLYEYTRNFFKKDDKILDIGSGFGSYVLLLRKNKFDAYGVEISEIPVKFARWRLQNDLSISQNEASTICKHATALNLPYEQDCFNVVTLWNVLEHIKNHAQVIREAMRILKPGGKLFIMNVNYSSCFIEPHYRVLWLPYLPKFIGKYYLRLIGKTSSYYENDIFYVSHANILKILMKEKASITNNQIIKLSTNSPPEIMAKYKKILYKSIEVFHLKRFLIFSLKIKLFNPYTFYTNIIVIKE